MSLTKTPASAGAGDSGSRRATGLSPGRANRLAGKAARAHVAFKNSRKSLREIVILHLPVIDYADASSKSVGRRAAGVLRAYDTVGSVTRRGWSTFQMNLARRIATRARRH